MTLLINQTPVDFTLTDEKTLADLETALRSWADASGQVVTSLLADGRTPVQDDPTPLDGIALVEIDLVNRDEAGRIQAGVVADYLDLLSRAAAAADEGALADLRREWPAVSAVLGGRAPSLEAAGTDPRALASAARTEAARWRAASLPPVPLNEAVEALEAQAGTLDALGTAFHQGRDRDALAGLDRFLAALEVLGRTAKGPEWETWHRELVPFLKEIEAALASGDFVLTADLLEYEVKPRLEGLRERLAL